VNGLKIENLHVTVETPDERPLIVEDDVANFSITETNLV
jgi:hypothetical protein